MLYKSIYNEFSNFNWIFTLKHKHQYVNFTGLSTEVFTIMNFRVLSSIPTTIIQQLWDLGLVTLTTFAFIYYLLLFMLNDIIIVLASQIYFENNYKFYKRLKSVSGTQKALYKHLLNKSKSSKAVMKLIDMLKQCQSHAITIVQAQNS